MTTTIIHEAEEPFVVPRDITGQLASYFDLPVPLAELLQRRGICSVETAKEFLYPDFATLPQPGLLKGVDQAVSVILDAVDNNVPVVIHGDYDVDGVTATVLFLRFFAHIGVRAKYYIPNRLEDSYGLSIESVKKVDRMLKGGKRVLITVDCGITSVDAVSFAGGLGFEVVITDHHQPPSILPDAAAVINPKQTGCCFPFKELSGVGVAFFTVAAIRRALIDRGFWKEDKKSIPSLKQYLDLVSLGTIADVMPLVGANRILVRGGLEVINRQRGIGVKALCRRCGIHDQDMISPETVSFGLAPRLNAAGRMGRADEAVQLLLTDSEIEAGKSAEKLDRLNTKRKKLESDILDSILSQCSRLMDEGANALTVFHENCHAGILGIIASRVVDRFKKPAIILTYDKNEADGECLLKGSGRSIEGVNLYEKLKKCEQHVKQFGGHKMAVGLTVPLADLEKFQQAFDECCRFTKTDQAEYDVPVADLHMRDKEFLNEGFMAKLQFLQPFGEGNPEPLFMLKKERLNQIKIIKDHLKFSLSSTSEKQIAGIGFYQADKLDTAAGGPVDIIFKFKRAYFKGTRRLEVQAIDISPSDE